MEPAMTDRSNQILLNRRPKSAWSAARKRQSLTDDADVVKHYPEYPTNFTSLQAGYSRDSFTKELEVFNKTKIELVGTSSKFENNFSKHLLKNAQRLNNDKSLNGKAFRIPGKCQRFKKNCEIIDLTDEYGEDEMFNRSKNQFTTHQQNFRKPHETKGHESQEDAWDSLDEEIEAFNRERDIKADNGSWLTTATGKGRLSNRLSSTKTSPNLDDIPSDHDGEQIILIEEITSLGFGSDQESIPQCGKRSQNNHVVAKRSYSDKGPSGKSLEKKNTIKYPASYNAGDLLTLDFEAARRNIKERYGFCSKIQGFEMSRDLSKEVYRPITKLKPIKLRQNKLDEDIGKQTNSRRLAPALLEALPSRLTNSTDQYSTPDLVTYDVIDRGFQQQQSELLKKCSMHDEKTPNQYPQDQHTSTSKGVFRRKDSDKSSYNNDSNYKHFVVVDPQRDCSNIIIRSSPEMSRPFDRTSSEAFDREPSMVNEFSTFCMQQFSVKETADNTDKKYDDSVDADVCLEDSSYSFDNDTAWNCQSITDFWHQTRKDFGSF